jgi:Cache domain
MAKQILLQTLTIKKLFLIITLSTVALCLYSLTTKDVTALDFDNRSQTSDYLNKPPLNSTDKFTILNLFANLLDSKISRVIDDLEISSRDETLKDVQFLKNVSSNYNGIHYTLDLDKRNLAKDILQRNTDIASIFFVLPNGDIYLGEPYMDQEQLPRINFADREWYKGVVKNNQTYISSIFMSASINAPAIAIAVPVYSPTGNLDSQVSSSSLRGYWVGIINLKSLADLFKSLSLVNKDQFILIDHNGTEFLDNKKSKIGPDDSSSHENDSSFISSNNLTKQKRLETFDYFDLFKDTGNETGTIYDKFNVEDQVWMFWKSVKVKDSNWYVVLVTRNDS